MTLLRDMLHTARAIGDAPRGANQIPRAKRLATLSRQPLFFLRTYNSREGNAPGVWRRPKISTKGMNQPLRKPKCEISENS
jgi:hypothetical protein